MGPDDIDAQFTEIANDPANVVSAELYLRLQRFQMKTIRVVVNLAEVSHLQSEQTSSGINAAANPPFTVTALRLWPNGESSGDVPWTHYRFEARGNDIVLNVDGEDRWRGSSPDDSDLVAAIESVAKESLVQAISKLRQNKPS